MESSAAAVKELPVTELQSQLDLKSLHSDKHHQIKAYILDHFTSSLPSFSVSDTQAWGHLKGLKLADPECMEPRPIDVLIGTDFFGSIVEPQIIKRPSDSPIAMHTIFSWLVLGPTSAVIPMVASSNHIAVSNEELYDLLTSVWLQEEVPKAEDSDPTKEEAECEFFQRTHSRDSSGRYVVRLPLARSPTELGDSYGRAKSCLSSLFRRMERDQRTLQLYSVFLKEYEDLGHMVRVPALTGSGNAGSVNFGYRSEGMTLPHGASASGGLRVPEEKQSARVSTQCSVQRESSETTKLTVVFNGSSKTSSWLSLNDIQYTGAELQKNISDVLLSSRRSRCIVKDWPLQQILWRDSQDQINTYQLTTVTYGTKSAPFLACRILNQLVADEGHRFPLAISPLTSGRYVDDLCGGAEKESDLLEVSKQVRDLCLAGAGLVEKLDWDDALSPQISDKWTQFRKELSQVENISIPRWLGVKNDALVEIHGFSDASQTAMAAVVYVKVTSSDGVSISLATAEIKVAPLKQLTIPRLELNAADMLAKLTRYVHVQLNLDNAPVFLWTDSGVTLAWISSHPSRWKEYVHNRVASIQELIPGAKWRYISGKENPADCASRGITVATLSAYKLWWT
ncbi:uncharacterized protein LOC107039109 [Diachasma alloeum]|uniref:uncharacterized protein LOC107039109 n=1 Tax=Diachasma alloeum TaxID=454923 RepID=UPI0007383EC9|nr:uncharacterized protein LOC107039109 [Diachasma alloeum]